MNHNNVPGYRFWHQGFGVRTLPSGTEYVPFLTYETCLSIMLRAQAQRFDVVPIKVGDLWAFKEGTV